MSLKDPISEWQALLLRESSAKIAPDSGSDRLADVFRFISFASDESYGPHRHRRIEINYLKKGNCTLRVGDATVGFNKDEMMIINSDVDHRFEAGPDGAQLMQLEFLPEVFSQFGAGEVGGAAGRAEQPDPQTIFSEDHPLIKIVNNVPIMRTVERIVHELEQRGTNITGIWS